MADIVDEVIRDKKEEKKLYYLKKALPIVLGITILIVFGMIINDFRKANAKSHNTEIGDTIINSLESLSNDPKIALEGLEYATENAKNHEKDIAALQIIAIYASSGNIEGAIAEIEKILDNKEYEELTLAYAKLNWITIKIAQSKLSDEEISKLESYFKDFTEKTPFFGSAKLYEALYYSKKDKEKSLSIAEEIMASKATSRNIKDEAEALILNLNIGK